MFEVRVESEFEAGHRRDADGEETALHHHQWKVVVRARAVQLDHIGIVVDFRVLRSAVDEVLAAVDQRVLEDIEPFDRTAPTVPAVAQWLFESLHERLETVTGGESGTEPDGTHEFWLSAVELEADADARVLYEAAG